MTEEKKTPIRISEGQMADVRVACLNYKPMQERFDELERTHGFEVIPNPKPGEFYHDVSVLFMYPDTIKPLDFSKLPAGLQTTAIDIAKSGLATEQELKNWEIVLPSVGETLNLTKPVRGLTDFMKSWMVASGPGSECELGNGSHSIFVESSNGETKILKDQMILSEDSKITDYSQELTLLHVPARIARMSKRRQKIAIAKKPLRVIAKFKGVTPVAISGVESDNGVIEHTFSFNKEDVGS